MGVLADPLSMLRQYYMNKKEIVERGNRILFGRYSWPKNVKTSFRMWRPSDQSNIKQYYTLECLLFMLKNIHLSHALYVRHAVGLHVPAVRLPDRKPILAYLSGETANCASIDKSAYLKTPIRRITGVLGAPQANLEGKDKMAPKSQSIVLPKRVPYSRYDQEKFITNRETADFNIDTMGSYQGMTLKSVVEGKSLTHDSHNATQLYLIPESPPAERRPSRAPIIIIPDANTSLISMVNVKDILQDHKFVSVHQKTSEGAVRQNEVFLRRSKGSDKMSVDDVDHMVAYRVVDDPSKLSIDEWDSVVAAFVLGPSWQFKGWPNEGNPVQIFANICAFHLKFEDMKLDVRMTRWAAHVLTLSRTERHLDRGVLTRFWEILDEHMMKNKPHL